MFKSISPELQQAIQLVDLGLLRAALTDLPVGSDNRNCVGELLSAIEIRAISLRSELPESATRLDDLEVIYLAVIDSLGAGSLSPYLTAWWSDRLVNEMLDRNFDPGEMFQSDEGEFGVLSLCARVCSGETVERVLRMWVDGGENGPKAVNPVVVACNHLNPEALRYLLGFLLPVPDGMTLEDLTREAIRIVSIAPSRADDLRMLVKQLAGAGVPLQAAPGEHSALEAAFEVDAYGAIEALLDAGCDPTRTEPSLDCSIETAIERSADPRMKDLFQAWRARVEVSKRMAPEKTFDTVLHDPLTVHGRGRTLN
jgi:hypothetical protein